LEGEGENSQRAEGINKGETGGVGDRCKEKEGENGQENGESGSERGKRVVHKWEKG
jgi:hypothetical protein